MGQYHRGSGASCCDSRELAEVEKKRCSFYQYRSAEVDSRKRITQSYQRRRWSVPASFIQKDLFARSGIARTCRAPACYGKPPEKSRFAKCGTHFPLPTPE